MTRKRPLQQYETPSYPSNDNVSNRRSFLKNLGKYSAIGATGLLLASCDHADSILEGNNIGDTGTETGTDTIDSEIMAGDIAPNSGTTSDRDSETSDSNTNDSETTNDSDTIDSAYIAGDIEPEPIDTEYLAGAIAPDSDTTDPKDTEKPDTELDTSYMAGVPME